MPTKPPAYLLLPCLLGLHAAALAQDAGSVRQQIEQQREQRLPAASPARNAAPAPAIKPQAGLTVTVRSVRFAGNELIGDARLSSAIASYLNRPLSFADLQRAADAVATVYADAGWVVRVYLPEQDLGTGVLTLQIIEARYGGQRYDCLLYTSPSPRD